MGIEGGMKIIRAKNTPSHCPATVPWEIVAPHQEQAIQNHGQTLEKLHGRGGVSIQELYAILRDRPYDSAVSERTAVNFVWSLIEAD